MMMIRGHEVFVFNLSIDWDINVSNPKVRNVTIKSDGTLDFPLPKLLNVPYNVNRLTKGDFFMTNEPIADTLHCVMRLV